MWHRPQKSSISDMRTRAKLSSTPAVYPWPRGSRSGILISTATVGRKPANTQPSAVRCGRGKPRPSGRGGCHSWRRNARYDRLRVGPAGRRQEVRGRTRRRRAARGRDAQHRQARGVPPPRERRRRETVRAVGPPRPPGRHHPRGRVLPAGRDRDHGDDARRGHVVRVGVRRRGLRPRRAHPRGTRLPGGDRRLRGRRPAGRRDGVQLRRPDDGPGGRHLVVIGPRAVCDEVERLAAAADAPGDAAADAAESTGTDADDT